jgi:ABC-2 type transport system permease protein
MRATSIIYRRELRAYLGSWVSWVIAAVLLLVAGILCQAYAMQGEQLSAIVLERFFWCLSGIGTVAAVIFAFRLVAEERQTSTMVLLNTSPVRDGEIIAGKFLAAMTFLAILLLLTFYMPLMIKVNGKITLAQVAVGYLGVLLLSSATLAVGLFGSALARNQLSAIIAGAVMVAILRLLYLFAAKLDSPVREAVQNMDLWWVHFQNSFEKGVLNLKDVVFYLAVTYFFLLLAVKALEAKRWQ